MVVSTKQQGSLEKLTVDKYFNLIEHAADGIAILQDGVFKLVNTALARISGYDKEELLGMPFTKLLTPESQKLAMARYQARLAGKEVPPIYEIKAVTKDGKVLNIEINAALTEYEGHVADEVIVRDITERKLAEEALADEATWRRILVDQSRDGIVILDQNGKVYEANQQFAEMLGYSGEEVRQLSVFDWEYLYPREQVLEMIRTVDEAGDHFETQHRRKDGSTYDVEISTNAATFAGQKLIFCVCRDITERKRAEEALRESQKFSSSLLESSPNPISVINPDTSVRYVNPAFEKLTGFTLAEITGRKAPYPWWPEGTRREIAAGLKDAMAHGGRRTERNFQKKNGERFWVALNSAPVVHEGKPVYFLLNWLDITQRKQMEQQLQEKNEQLDAQNEELRAINEELQATEQQLQENNEQLDAQNEELRAVNEELQATEQQLQENNEQLDAQNEELRAVNEELQATEEELQQSQEKLERMFESVTDGIVVATLDGIILKVNKKAAQMHGFASEDELLGKNAFELVAPRDHKRITNNLRKALKEGLIRSQEYTLLKSDGSEFPGELSTNTLKDASGNVIGHITIARDITKRKQMEELFKTVTNSSPVGIYIVQDRKFQLANPQFQKLTGYTEDELLGMDSLAPVLDEDKDMVREKAVKMLKGEHSFPYQFRVVNKAGETRWVMETVTSIQYRGRRAILGNYMDITERRQAEEKEKLLQEELNLTSRLASIGQMASGVAHEINNPLTGVIGFSHLMMSRDIPNDMKQDLQVINSEAKRVAKIVENLLTFARQRKPGREYVDINSIVARVLELRSYEMKVNNIEVETQLAPDLPYTMADADQLQQVFLNIILNAEHFMTTAHNKGKLLVKTERIDDNIRASFTDDGSGISKENLNKIFNPFFTTKEVGSGTGLGLSICHGIITQHKGRIYAQSELDQGATFVVELPIVDEPTPAGQAEVTKDEPEKPKGAKILVVDDEPAVLAFLRRLLTEWGHSVETMNSANAALDRIKTERYSLILLDIKLPGMSGVELYSHIEAIAPALTRRVMFITGDIMETATRDFLDRTKVPHITKPLDIELLKKTINHTLNQTHVAATTPG